jgi:hypothetical protein
MEESFAVTHYALALSVGASVGRGFSGLAHRMYGDEQEISRGNF